MLNCCIEHKKKREQLHKGYTGDLDSPPGSPFRGPSTSQMSRSLSHEDVISPVDSESQTGTCASSSGVSQDLDSREERKRTENVNARAKSGGPRPASVRLVSSSESSDEEFFECNDQNNSENMTDEKDVDTATENAEDESGNGNEVENISDTEMECEASGLEEESLPTGSVNENSESVADSESVSNVSAISDSMFKESYSYKPEGRLATFQDLKLINCEERMYIPVTQEPAPMTEDMLEEHAEVLAK